MSTSPAAWAGDTAVIWESDTTVKLAAGVPPNDTDVAPVNPLPVTVTIVPPAVGPDCGLMPVTAGAGAQVNWSALERADVPAMEVTVTSALPVPAGDTAVIWESDTTVKLAAGVPPNDTDVAPVNPLPVTVTIVPPAVGPDCGLMPVTAGAGAQVNWSALERADVPAMEVTVTSALPVPAGDTAVIWESDTTVKLAAGVPPNDTDVAPVNPLPVTVTIVPPAVGPDCGLMPVTAGAGAQVNWSALERADVPAMEVTVTSALPVPAGDTAVIWESDTTVKLAAGVPPNDTDVAPVNPLPVTVTIVPPAVGPDCGLMPVTAGADTTVSMKAC